MQNTGKHSKSRNPSRLFLSSRFRNPDPGPRDRTLALTDHSALSGAPGSFQSLTDSYHGYESHVCINAVNPSIVVSLAGNSKTDEKKTSINALGEEIVKHARTYYASIVNNYSIADITLIPG